MVRASKKRTIKEFFENSQKRVRNEDQELLLALELSKKEHIKEQKKLLSQIPKKKLIQRLSEEEIEDEWFQTISSRPQPKKKRPIKVKKEAPPEVPPFEIENLSEWLKVKEEQEKEDQCLEIENLSEWLKAKEEKEEEGQTLEIENLSEWLKAKEEKEETDQSLEIENLSEWLKAKEEKQEEDRSIEIEDLSAFLAEQSSPIVEAMSPIMEEQEREKESHVNVDPVINLTEDSQPSFRCSICNQMFLAQSILDDHEAICRNAEVISDDDDNCSVIDLVDNNPEIYSVGNDYETQTVQENDNDMEDDGYLSPLEGFTSISENREEYNNYLQQLQHKPPTKRKPRAKSATSASTQKKRQRYFAKKWYRKKKK